jgi:putative peptidoglycan lipid II flippase
LRRKLHAPVNLLRAASTVSILTLASRITGLLREILVANFFGANALTDAFNVAFRLPNLLRRLFAEGAFSQAFVPQLARMHASEELPTQQVFLNAVATVLFWTLVLTAIVGIAAAPALVWLMGSGLQKSGSFELAVLMTRLMFPYILFISLVAFAAGILNTFKQFAIPAATPVILNVAVVACGYFLSGYVDPPILALCIGVIAGGVLQLALQLPALARHALLPRVSFRIGDAWRHPGVKQLLLTIAPATLAVAVAQISIIINTHIATTLQAGSASWISTADRLMEFPTALLGVALGVVLMPSLTRAHAQGEEAQFNALLNWGLKLVWLLALPCAVALLVFSTPLVASLFFHGKFTATDTLRTAEALSAYGVGLVALISIKILAPGFYAKGDVRTPVKIALVVLVVTQVLNQVFLPWFAHAALTLSIALGSILNALLLWFGLRRKKSIALEADMSSFMLKVVLASTLLGIGLWFAAQRLPWLESALLPRIALLAAVLAASAVFYFGLLVLLGVRPRQFLKKVS